MAVAVKEINPSKYGRLLAKTLPTVIKTEAENERMLAEIERLMVDTPRAEATGIL